MKKRLKRLYKCYRVKGYALMEVYRIIQRFLTLKPVNYIDLSELQNSKKICQSKYNLIKYILFNK